MSTEKAILAGGCFWGVQELVRRGQNFVVTIDGSVDYFFFAGSNIVAREGGCDGSGGTIA